MHIAVGGADLVRTTATRVDVGKSGVATRALGGLQGDALDRAAAGTLTIGASTATEVDLGSASVLTKALGAFTSVGALKAPSLDTAGAAVLPVGGATATEVDLGRSGQPVKIPGTVSGAFSDLRTVAAIYNTTTAQSIGSGAGLVVVNFGTKVLDTDNAVTTGAGWAFTVPAGKVRRRESAQCRAHAVRTRYARCYRRILLTFARRLMHP